MKNVEKLVLGLLFSTALAILFASTDSSKEVVRLATLKLCADAGKATITLAVEFKVEVEVSQNVNQTKLARNSPSRQRRRERRAKSRPDEADKAEHEAVVDDSVVKGVVAASEHESEMKTSGCIN